MRVINIIDSLLPINVGVWQSASSTGEYLQTQGIDSELWCRESSGPVPSTISIPVFTFKLTNKSSLRDMINQRKLNPKKDIIVTHGCWQYATKWGAHLRNEGFRWVYVPHGMLEPWPLQHKKWKKTIYLKLVEKQLAKKADLIRAVSSSEAVNLKNIFSDSDIRLIPNGVKCDEVYRFTKNSDVMTFVFMARLHEKKGVIHLVNAWIKSSLNNNPGYQLRIAGPDEGQLPLIERQVKSSSNIEYIGAVNKTQRDELLGSAHFYVLPSYSEGFPTSVLEAMEKGAIPVITRECNFNEAFDAGLAIEINPDAERVKVVLEDLATFQIADIRAMAERSYEFIRDNYSLEHIALLQSQLYLNSKENEKSRPLTISE